ncbi:signal peptidase I [Candidatus Parcubacteria bacterium]|nr:MAG: signal peptidase I [Candidatus Parcubacteria bacterium]
MINKLSSLIMDLIQTFVIAGAIFVVMYAFIFRLHQVDGQSMYPTLHNKDLMITNVIELKFNSLKRGDIIVFEAPPPNADKDYIKRIIGLPGEKIMVRDGDVYINNNKLDESSYLPSDYKTYGERFLRDGQDYVIPEGSYFAIGDNRTMSSDSRDFGPIRLDKVIGKSFISYWPVDRFRIIKGAEYGL